MKLESLKLITVVAESLVSDRIIREIQRLGARGYTVTPAGGEGGRGARAGSQERRNVRIETLVAAPMAEKILRLLNEYYVPQYAVVAFVQPVDVINGDRYV